MPESFTATELPGDSGGTILLFQNTSGDGIQLIITPFDEDLREIAKERVERDNPDLTVSDAQVLEITENYTGLAFKSDQPAFGGDSREIWFVHTTCADGACEPMLYQISTFGYLDPLLKAIFATWKFF